MSMADVEKLGAQCGREALDAAGDAPWGNLGRSLLPTGPQRGDWDALEDALEREPTDREREAFEDGYNEVIEEGRGEIFGARVRNVRDYLDIPQTALADILQVAPNTMARWERGELTPDRGNEAGIIVRLRRLVQHRWAEQEHRANEYDALARDALEGDGFSPDTAEEVARICRNTADSIRDAQEDPEGD